MKLKPCPFCGNEVDMFIFYNDEIVGCKYCGVHISKPSNADRIRAMTDEELTEWYYTDPFEPDPWCTPNNVQCRHKDLMAKKDEEPCKICFLAWLKEEAKE